MHLRAANTKPKYASDDINTTLLSSIPLPVITIIVFRGLASQKVETHYLLQLIKKTITMIIPTYLFINCSFRCESQKQSIYDVFLK